MAKFRKRVKIAPGVNINLSKSGISGTFGMKGASVNVGKNGAFVNTGIPGTGIYDRHKLGDSDSESDTAAEYATDDETQSEQGGAKVGALGAFGGLLVLGGIIFLIGYFVSGSFWVKKLIAGAVFIFGIFICLKSDKNAPQQEAEKEKQNE